ncbi:hypothetical protein SAMN05216241_106137 [Limimonas halophila]|uniref:Uncharacterized protein n=1 Tax=Limimonas halophila TaxID=1082479 RepID=A0A1G7S6B7_9PROT|nr:hypothetical protein [Limimonas halophila]SDG18494.1 hypothetical protein SAMN05216241_106137 [Limimonas halophila]
MRGKAAMAGWAVVAAGAAMTPEFGAAGSATAQATAHVVGAVDTSTRAGIAVVLARPARQPGAVAVHTTGEVVARGGARPVPAGCDPGRLRVDRMRRLTLRVGHAHGTQGAQLVPLGVTARASWGAASDGDATLTLVPPPGPRAVSIRVGATFAVPLGAEADVYRAEVRVDSGG